MPRSRDSEGAQRQSPRGVIGPPHLRTSSSDSNHRSITNGSPKFGDRRSPRGAQSDPILSQKKLGTRVADLESQLGQAQIELKNLKGQLANAEAAKKEAQVLLGKKTKKTKAKNFPDPVQLPNKEDDEKSNEIVNEENHRETDVFEVPKAEITEIIGQESDETKPTSEMTDSPLELKTPSFDDLLLKDDEINQLKSKLEERDRELEASRLENESLIVKLNEANTEKLTIGNELEERKTKLALLGSELEGMKASEDELKNKLEGAEMEKDGLENEMKKMKVQTEQWRKAADAAAAVLAGGMEMDNGRRVSERCGSMDKHVSNILNTSYNAYVGSPGFGDDSDDGFGGGKRKSSGIRMFGDLWKKKGQK